MANYLVAFDPGLRVAGMAVFRDRVLVHAALLKSECLHERGPMAHVAMSKAAFEFLDGLKIQDDDSWFFATEWPQVYFKTAFIDPDDLAQLAGVVGAVATVVPGPSKPYFPRQWKGQVPKKTHVGRVKDRMCPEELALVKALKTGALEHNVIDAVGIGLYHLGRMQRYTASDNKPYEVDNGPESDDCGRAPFKVKP